MKTAVRSAFPTLLPGVMWRYFIINNPFARVRELCPDEDPYMKSKPIRGAKEVTKKEALAYIKENGLVLALDTEDGRIWDTPEGSFKNTYHIDSKAKMASINGNWDTI